MRRLIPAALFVAVLGPARRAGGALRAGDREGPLLLGQDGQCDVLFQFSRAEAERRSSLEHAPDIVRVRRSLRKLR